MFPKDIANQTPKQVKRFCKHNTLKDLDLDYVQKFISPHLINLSEPDREDLLAIIQSDIDFFTKHNLMDYSLLIAVEKLPSDYGQLQRRRLDFFQKLKSQLFNSNKSTIILSSPLMGERTLLGTTQDESFYNFSGALVQNGLCKLQSKCKRYVYHIAIIDFLQKFNFSKKTERAAKVFKKAIMGYEDGEEGPDFISSIRPEKYRDRFFKYCSKSVFKTSD